MNQVLVEIDGIVVNKDILHTRFSCDLNKCKGACCTLESEYGAPLLEEELPLMQESLGIALEYLPEEHRTIIEKKNFFERKDGELVTRSVKNRACVFVFYENEVAKCAYERAYFEGRIKFRKPISCHLFPIRITDFMGDVLRYEKFSECTPALELGEKENTTIAEFCKDSLERKYGTEWYSKLIQSKQK